MLKTKIKLKIVTVCILSTFLVFSPGFPYDGVAQDFRIAMEEADVYLKNGQYLEAMGAYQEILDRASDRDMRARALLRIGDIYGYYFNSYDRALEKYEAVKKQYGGSPHAANAYFNAGMILYEKSRHREALNQFKAYIEKYPRGDRRDSAEFMVDVCSRPPPVGEEKKKAAKFEGIENIRVLVKTGARDARFDSPSFIDIRSGDEKKALTRVESVVVDVHQRSIRLNGSRLAVDRLVIAPSEGAILMLNGQPYRGKFRILKNPKGGMDIVNILGIEAYLYGVVPTEMSPLWFPDALKAQAIAARSYAFYQMDKNKNREFDILATTASQVYGGVRVEMESSSRAVDETRGMVLHYNDQPVLAYFHGNSGGMTEDSERVWSAEIPYLKAVRDDYSLKAPTTAWDLTLRLDDIGKTLRRKGVDIGAIEKLSAEDISPSGRVMKIRIFHEGQETVLSGNDFRLKMNPAIIKSTLFTITHNGQDVRFEGKGYGHGVGMSQWGAYIMAREGRSYRDILRYFYQGVDIITYQ